MANRPDIPECGRIEQDFSRTGRNSKLEYSRDSRKDPRFGASVSYPDHSPSQDKAIHEAIARNVGSRRDNNDEVLPLDPIDDQIGK